MAKVTFLQGKARGKVGGIVYRTEAGLGTIASEYNPSPRNPRTIAQTKQRNKMNLAGQLSKITPYAAIAGLSNNRRNARSTFVSNLLNAVSVDNTTMKASIEFAKVMLSSGIRVPISATFNDAQSQTGGIVTRTVTFTPSLNAENILGYLAVTYEKRRGDTTDTYIDCDVRTLASNETSFEIVCGMPSAPSSVMAAATYIIPIVDTGIDARAAYAQLSMNLPDTGGLFEASAVRTLVSAGSYAESVLAVYSDVEP